MFQAAFLLAFFGFLRVGEFTLRSKFEDAHRVPTIEDIQLCCTPTEFGFCAYQIFQNGSIWEFCYDQDIRNETENLCPVKAMKAFLQVRPLIRGRLFCHADYSPIIGFQFSAVLRKSLAYAGTPPSRYGTHSFRIVAAPTVAMAGVLGEEIRAMGRQRSGVYIRYIRQAENVRQANKESLHAHHN